MIQVLSLSQANWRGKQARKGISSKPKLGQEATLRRVVTLLERLEQRVVRLEKSLGTLPVAQRTGEQHKEISGAKPASFRVEPLKKRAAAKQLPTLAPKEPKGVTPARGKNGRR